MAVSHDKAIAAHNGFAFGRSTAVHSSAFTDYRVVAYNGQRLFSTEFQVLWNTRDYRTGIYKTVLSNTCTIHYGHIVADMGAFPYLHISLYGHKRIDYYAGMYFSGGVNIC